MAASIWFRLVSAGAFRRTRETIGAITGYLQETLSGIRVVRSFGQEPVHEARFAELNRGEQDANMATVRLNAAYFPGVEMLSGVAVALIVLYGGYQAIEGHITAGTVVAFVAALSYLFEPIQQLSQLYTTYQSGMAALEKIFQLLDVAPNLADRPDAHRARAHPRASSPSRTSPSPTTPRADETPLALEHVDLDDPPGPDRRPGGRHRRGEVHDGQARGPLLRPDLGPGARGRPRPARGLSPLAALADGHRAPGGVPVLRARSPRTSPSAVPTPAREIRAAAAAVGAEEFIAELPHGYDTEVGERGAQLSAGQRQLIAFARALIADPRILVLDEATSNVDLHTEGHIEQGLRRLLAGRTAIVIAHRLSTIRQAGRIVVLEHGQHRRAGHPRGAARRRRPLLRALPRLGRAGGLRPTFLKALSARPAPSAPRFQVRTNGPNSPYLNDAAAVNRVDQGRVGRDLCAAAPPTTCSCQKTHYPVASLDEGCASSTCDSTLEDLPIASITSW